MIKGFEETLLQRTYTGGRKAREKMLNILSH